MQVEFNKAAQSLTEAAIPSAQKKNALNRLVKVGIVSVFLWSSFHTDKRKDLFIVLTILSLSIG